MERLTDVLLDVDCDTMPMAELMAARKEASDLSERARQLTAENYRAKEAKRVPLSKPAGGYCTDPVGIKVFENVKAAATPENINAARFICLACTSFDECIVRAEKRSTDFVKTFIAGFVMPVKKADRESAINNARIERAAHIRRIAKRSR